MTFVSDFSPLKANATTDVCDPFGLTVHRASGLVVGVGVGWGVVDCIPVMFYGYLSINAL